MVAQPTEHIRMDITEKGHVNKRGGEGLRLEGKELAVILFAGGQSVEQGTQCLGSHVVSINKGGWSRHEGGDAGASSINRHTASKQTLEDLKNRGCATEREIVTIRVLVGINRTKIRSLKSCHNSVLEERFQ